MLRWLTTHKQLRAENARLHTALLRATDVAVRNATGIKTLAAQLEARDRDLERALADNKRLTLAALSRSMRVGQVVGRDPVTGLDRRDA